MQHCRGVDFVSSSKDAPFCPHGPTLLFERYYEDHPPRKYFACSVYRDRKQCSFFVWADTKITPERKKRWLQLFEDSRPRFSRQELMERLYACRKFERDEDREYCCICSLLVLPSDLISHEMHTTVCPISCQDLSQPSKFLPAVTSRKGEAQYFFTDECTKFILSSLESEGFTTVVCVGTPRVHEAITCHSGKLKSFLLDIDYRYAQFFTPDQYQQFNLFTAFFYDTVNGQKHLKDFISTERQYERIALIIDPPFGGLADVIADGIKQLWELIGTEITTFLIFPYFLESHVLKSLPNFIMLDYEVTYDNHLYFKKAKHRPSFVRIFTNMSLPGLKLPANKGYRFCKKCNRYVNKNNYHCEECNICPSKDGKLYVHCQQCQKCVKGGYIHCSSCSTCLPASHVCHSVVVSGCHVCGSTAHKRRDCTRKFVKEITRICDRKRSRECRKKRWHRKVVTFRRMLYSLNHGF